MDARLPPELDAFRLDIRAFLKAALPADIRARWIETSNVLFADRADTVRWQKSFTDVAGLCRPGRSPTVASAGTSCSAMCLKSKRR